MLIAVCFVSLVLHLHKILPLISSADTQLDSCAVLGSCSTDCARMEKSQSSKNPHKHVSETKYYSSKGGTSPLHY